MLYVHGVTYSDEVGSNYHMPQCNTICFAHHRLYDKITYDIHSIYIIIKQFLAFIHINSSKIFGFRWALFSYQNWIWYIAFGIIDTSWSRYDTKKFFSALLVLFWKKSELGRFNVFFVTSFNKLLTEQSRRWFATPWRSCDVVTMESALLALCAGNSPVTGEFPAQRPVTQSFGVFFDLRLNRWLSK